MIRFGPGKDINLAITGEELGVRYRTELLEQNHRARGLWKRLYEQNQPGVVLADEVGKGKTYVALAVAFARLATRPKGHVLVLTHSGHMARIWRERWRDLEACVSSRWRHLWNENGWDHRQYWSIDHLADDSRNRNLPQIAFASYEALKKYGSEQRDAGYLLTALRRTKSLGIRLRDEERNALIKDMIECDLRSVKPERLSDANAKQILRWLDPDTRRWREDAYNAHAVYDVLDHIHARSKFDHGAFFDLLIVDEAHKLEGTSRHRVVTRLLRKRFDKCVLVTATPFALSVNQFRRRLLDFVNARGISGSFEDAIQVLPLDEFSKAVAERIPYQGKEDLERRLRRHMIRASWNHARERRTEYWKKDASPEAILPTLLLERLINDLLQSGHRTHIASRRESLCSSWPAARRSLKDSPLKGVDKRWSHAFDAVVSERAAVSDPKLTKAVDELVELIQHDTKVVVFTQRLNSSKSLARLLTAHPTVREKARAIEGHSNRFRRHIDKVAEWLELEPSYAAGVVKVMAHVPDRDRPKLDRVSVLSWWKRHKKRLGEGDLEKWSDLKPILGRARRLPLLVRYDAEIGRDERNIEKFNLPSSPLILIATPKAQEGIDLHHYCRHVVLFDLTWNPAAMEQRIGRVHRLGGIRGPRDKVIVIYCFQNGTYEEVMAKRVQQRCEMMRVLLGAGQWLDEDREIEDLSKYEMTFPA